jgi:hypothetical protein
VSVTEYVAWNWPGLVLVLVVAAGVPAVLVARRNR